MWVKGNECPCCGEALIFEAIGNYGDLFQISKKTGKILKKRIRRIHYEYSDDFMVYCSKCGTNYDYRRDNQGIVYITQMR